MKLAAKITLNISAFILSDANGNRVHGQLGSSAPHLLHSSKHLWLVLGIGLKNELLEGVMDGENLWKLLLNLQQVLYHQTHTWEVKAQAGTATLFAASNIAKKDMHTRIMRPNNGLSP